MQRRIRVLVWASLFFSKRNVGLAVEETTGEGYVVHFCSVKCRVVLLHLKQLEDASSVREDTSLQQGNMKVGNLRRY